MRCSLQCVAILYIAGASEQVCASQGVTTTVPLTGTERRVEPGFFGAIGTGLGNFMAGLFTAREVRTENHVGDVNQADMDGLTPLAHAVRNRDIPRVTMLIGLGANVNPAEGVSLIHIAALNGDVELAELLVAHGANVNARNRDGATAFHIAIQMGNINLVRALMTHANVYLGDRRELPPLHMAVMGGFVEIATLLLDRGANVRAIDPAGFPALHVAARQGDINMATALMDRGANVHTGAMSRPRCGALDVAARHGQIEMVQLLITRGANVNQAHALGRTPLHFAILAGRLDIVELLYRNGADLEAVASNGGTLLMLAARHGCVEIVQFLLGNRVQLETVNADGATALDIARDARDRAPAEEQYRFGTIVQLVEQALGQENEPFVFK